MFTKPFKKPKKTVKQMNKLVFSPVYSKKIISTFYRVGEILPHARMKLIHEDMNIMLGTCYKEDKALYFVATDSEVIDHIRKQGAVPLIESSHLRIFTEKKRMQAYINKYQSISA